MSGRSARILPAFLAFLVVTALPSMAQVNAALLKWAPPSARPIAGGKELPWKASLNGYRLIPLSEGSLLARLEAPGFIPKSILLLPSASLDVKLERRFASLRLRSILSTAPRPKSVAFSPDGRTLFSAPLSGRGIDAWDASSLEELAFMSPPESWASQEGFTEMAFLPERGELLVSQLYSQRIHVFSLRDLSWKRSLPSHGSFPKVILPAADGKSFWVSTWLSKRVNRIDAETGELLLSFSCDAIPRGLASSSDGGILWVALFEPGGVERRDGRSGKLIHRFLEGGAKRHIVMDGPRDRLYVSDMARGMVYAFSAADDSLIDEIRVGPMPNSIAMDPYGERLYVSLRGPNNPLDYEQKGPEFGSVAVVDLQRMAVVERVWGGNQPTGLALSPDGTTLAFSDFLDHRVELYRIGRSWPRSDPRVREQEGYR